MPKTCPELIHPTPPALIIWDLSESGPMRQSERAISQSPDFSWLEAYTLRSGGRCRLFTPWLVNKLTSFIFCTPAPRAAAAPEPAPAVLHLPGPTPVAVFAAAVSEAAAPSSAEGHVPGPCPVPAEGPAAGLQHVV